MCKSEHSECCGCRAASSMHKSQSQGDFTTRYCCCQESSGICSCSEYLGVLSCPLKKFSCLCRKMSHDPYFLSVRAFKPCTLTTECSSGREIQQPRTVCDDMSVPAAYRCTAATATRALSRSAGTDCRMAQFVEFRVVNP